MHSGTRLHSDSMQFYHFQPLHAQTSGLYCFGCHGNGVPNYTSQCHTDQKGVRARSRNNEYKLHTPIPQAG